MNVNSYCANQSKPWLIDSIVSNQKHSASIMILVEGYIEQSSDVLSVPVELSMRSNARQNDRSAVGVRRVRYESRLPRIIQNCQIDSRRRVVRRDLDQPRPFVARADEITQFGANDRFRIMLI